MGEEGFLTAKRYLVVAESVVSPLLSVLSEKLVAALVVVGDRTTTLSVVRFRKLNISHHTGELLNRELKKLHSSVLKLQPLLIVDSHNCSSSSSSSSSCVELKKYWVRLKQAQDAALQVDDILDQMFLFSPSSNSMVHKVSESFSLSKIQFFYSILGRIKHVTEMFDEIINRYLPEHLKNRKSYETSSVLYESQVYGREGDKMKIVDMLLISPSEVEEEEENLSFISIVGMGGLGKTTLAKLVFNDEWVVRYFEKRVWIHVGQVFDEAKIVQKIIESVEGVSCRFEQMSFLAVELLEVLQGRRFLIVLDDLWNESGERWYPLKDFLRRSSCERCKIIVTTRSVEVARIIDTSSMFQLGALSDEHCRALIFDQASLYEQESEETAGLLEIAKVWAKKCKGLPLAAKAVGSELLYRRPMGEEGFLTAKRYLVVAESVVSPLLSVISEKLVAAVIVVDDQTTTLSVVRFRKLNISHHTGELLNRELKKLHSSVLKLEPLLIVDSHNCSSSSSSSCDELKKAWVRLKQVQDAALQVDDILDQMFLFSPSSNSMVHKVSESFSLSEIHFFYSILCRIKHVTEMFDEIIDGYLPEHEGISSFEAVLGSLKLSYDYLPSDLKECFAYCSIFPKGCTIKKDNLIQLWMAEGFIQSSQQRITLEEIGNDYFMKLLWMSFFQAAKQDGCGNIIEITMHDFVHDLAKSVSKFESSILEAGEVQKTSHTVRYLSLVCDPTLTEFPKPLFSQSLRTLLLFSASKYLKRVPSDTFSSFRCLRVLCLSGTGIDKLPASVCMLIHLRYLDLSHTSIKKLPKSFSALMNLQTLKLSYCYRLLELPKDLKTMVNLRHLDINQCCSLYHLPSGLGQLTCLQTLSMFIVGMDKQCSLRELKWLNLGGKLEIKNLKHVTNFLDVEEANLMEKPNLQSLELSWGHEYKEDLDRSEGYVLQRLQDRSEGYVLERLQPHSNLKELSITGCMTAYFPEWIGNLLNLVKISIINFRHCNYLLSLGQLPHLKYLYIKGMDAIECVDYAFYGNGALKGFPSLEEIEIYNMPKLEEWWTLPESRDTFTRLNKLTVKGCPCLTMLPFFPVLNYLTLWGSNESLLSSVGNQPSLSSLVINDFQDLSSLLDEIGSSTSLKKITVYNCNNLISILENGNLEGLTSLEQLSILYCKDLRYLSAVPRHLNSLQKLDIIQCPQLAYLPELIELTSLQALTIDGCPRFASFPDGMHRMVSLQELRIRSCPNLKYLPMGFEHITSLLYLEIGGCDILESRLQINGQDWHKIAHVPTISIVQI